LNGAELRAVALIAIISLIAGAAGCKGPSGPDGEDAFIPDSLPPGIEWISPEAGQMIDSLAVLSARVHDDQGVRHMSFYIAGFEFAGVLVDTAGGIYCYEWLAVNWPEGPYPLMGRAWDDARNVATTPLIIVQVEHP